MTMPCERSLDNSQIVIRNFSRGSRGSHLRLAEEKLKEIRSSGFPVEKVDVDSEELILWCNERSLKITRRRARRLCRGEAEGVGPGPTTSLGFVSRSIKYTTARCLAKYDIITINHRHRDGFQFVLPQLTFVKRVLHLISFIQ